MTSARVIPFPVPNRALELRPPRLTFAGCCLWCGAQDCAKPDCIGLHDISEWVVCGDCKGTGESTPAEPMGCTCAFGLALVAPEIERRREIVPGSGMHAIDRGHWPQYNHKVYGSEQQCGPYTVVGGSSSMEAQA